MPSEKTAKIVEEVRNMTDYEADILEIFLSGFRAGKQAAVKEKEGTSITKAGCI